MIRLSDSRQQRSSHRMNESTMTNGKKFIRFVGEQLCMQLKVWIQQQQKPSLE